MLLLVTVLALVNTGLSKQTCTREDFLAHSACRKDFVLYLTMGKCIRPSVKMVTYTGASLMCSHLGSRLLRVDTAYVNSALVRGPLESSGHHLEKGRAIKAISKTIRYWISLNDLQEEGEYRWGVHGPMASWSNWAVQEPNSSQADMDCVLRDGQGLWRVALCRETHHFLCETFVGEHPKPPEMVIVFDRPPSTMNSGSELVVNCTGFVADRGELRFEHNKPIPGNGASGFVILSDDPLVDYEEDRLYVINQQSGACGRRSRASLKMTVTGDMHGATISCCAFLHSGFNECQNSPVISVYFPAQPPILHIDFDQAPAIVVNGHTLTAKCMAFVGSQGYLSWIIKNGTELLALWIHQVQEAGVISDPRPLLFEGSKNSAGMDNSNGPWLSSVIDIPVDRSMHGISISCCSYKYNISKAGLAHDDNINDDGTNNDDDGNANGDDELMTHGPVITVADSEVIIDELKAEHNTAPHQISVRWSAVLAIVYGWCVVYGL